MSLTAKMLRSVLRYNQRTGAFVWRRSTSRKRLKGERAGTLTHGYTIITIFGQHYRASRLAWFYVHGRWPLAEPRD